MNVREQVDLAVRNYAELPPAVLSEELPEEEHYLATPDRLAFALGWVVANAIVGARYADSALDAVPVFHPEHGWDRFLLTRRVSGDPFVSEPADSFGLIMLSGEDAPVITLPSGKPVLALGNMLREDADAAIVEAVAQFEPTGLPSNDLGKRWADRQRHYPVLFNALTELILERPGLVVAREIFVDDQPVDGAYHPLYLHAVALKPAMTYDWFLAQLGEQAAFMRVHGGQSIYETDRKGWSTVRRQLNQEDDPERLKQRIRNWLRLDGAAPEKDVD
jgi:hypothetical protein